MVLYIALAAGAALVTTLLLVSLCAAAAAGDRGLEREHPGIDLWAEQVER